MKIIIFFPIFNRGGLEEVAKLLIKFFLKKNLKLELITFKKIKYNFNSKNIKIFYPPQNLIKRSNLKKTIKCLNILVNRLKKNNPENTKILSLQNSILAIIFAKFFNYEIIIKNANPIKALFLSGNRLYNFFIFLMKIISYNFANKIIVNSEYNKKTLSRYIINKKKIYRIFNPVSLHKYKFRKKQNNILYVGRLVKEKGLETLIKAFNLISYKSYKLIIVGDGEHKKKLRRLVMRENLTKKVIFTGWKNNPKKYYLTSKIFILPSKFEAFGNSLIEAMHYQLSCIVSRNSGGPDEIMKFGKLGYLFKIDDTLDLKNKINFCIRNKSISNKKIVLAKKNLKRFSNKKSYSSYYKIIKNINSV